MADPANFMEGVTDTKVTFQVTRGQFEQLAKDQVGPSTARVIYRIALGPFAIPSNWVVVGVQSRQENTNSYFVTLARLED